MIRAGTGFFSSRSEPQAPTRKPISRSSNGSRNVPGGNGFFPHPIRAAGADSQANQPFVECLALILDHGVDPDVPRFGRTTLHYACAQHGSSGGEDRARFAAMLPDHGAAFPRRDDILKSTPLGWASRWGHKKVVELLLDRGAPAIEPDAEPWAQPLAWASKMNHPEIAALLEPRAKPA